MHTLLGCAHHPPRPEQGDTMARICSECLNVVPTVQHGRCPDCHTGPTDTRAPGWQRYPAEYRANRLKILEGNPPCHWCGAPADTADHLTPRAHGGSHGLDNLVPSCGPCNYSRGAQLGNHHRRN